MAHRVRIGCGSGSLWQARQVAAVHQAPARTPQRSRPVSSADGREWPKPSSWRHFRIKPGTPSPVRSACERLFGLVKTQRELFGPMLCACVRVFMCERERALFKGALTEANGLAEGVADSGQPPTPKHAFDKFKNHPIRHGTAANAKNTPWINSRIIQNHTRKPHNCQLAYLSICRNSAADITFECRSLIEKNIDYVPFVTLVLIIFIFLYMTNYVFCDEICSPVTKRLFHCPYVTSVSPI